MLRQMLATTNDLTFTVARLIRSSQIRGKNNKSQRSLQPGGAASLSFGSEYWSLLRQPPLRRCLFFAQGPDRIERRSAQSGHPRCHRRDQQERDGHHAERDGIGRLHAD
jgi:hypothetical protein